MNDFSEVERAMTEMSNAAGSADDEMKIIQDSIDYKLNALKESWVGFIQEALKREDTKELFDALLDGSKSLQQSLTTITPALTAFIKVLTQLLEVVAKVNSATGGLAGLAGLIYGGAKVKGKVNDVRGVMGGLLGGDNNKKSILSGLSLDKIKGFLSKDVTDVFGKTAKAVEEVGTSAATAATEVDEMFDVMSAANSAATYSEAMGTAAAAETAVGGAAAGATISVGALLGILAIAAVVIGAGVIAFNHFNVTVEEVKKEVEDAESKVASLNNEIKELESLENRTNAQQNRLNLLKKELAVQNQILESRKKLLLLEQTGTKATDRFDMENYNTLSAVETGNLVEDKNWWSNLWGHFFVGFKDTFSETAEDILGDINSDTSEYHRIASEFEAINDEINSEAFKSYDESRKTQLLNSRERHLEMLQDAENALSESIIKADAKANELEGVLLQMEEDGISKDSQSYKNIEKIIKQLRSSSKAAQKDTGTYDVFADPEFIKVLSNHDEGALKDLINSEKSHDEIVKILKRDYSDLIEVLEQNGYGVGHLIAKYNELTNAENAAKEAANDIEPLSINDSIDALSSLGDQVGKIDAAFAELFNPDDMQIDLSSIKAIKDEFAKIENFDLSTIEDELDALYNATSVEEAQEAVDSLVNSFIAESTILEKLDDTNKDLITSELKRMGISNAEEVVNSALAVSEKEVAINKEFNATKSKDLVNATSEEIEEFIEETNRAGEAAQEVYIFALRKKFAAGIDINNPNEIQYLIDMAREAGVAADACDKLAVAKSRMQAVEAQYEARKRRIADINQQLKQSNTPTIVLEDETGVIAEYEQAAADAEKYAKEIEDALKKDATLTPVKPVFSGGKAVEDAKKSASSAAKDTAETFDWLETKIQRCEEEIQRLDKTVSATYKGWAKRNTAIGSELDKIREKIALQTTAYNVYMKKANSIGLSEHYKNLVKNGGLVIEDIADENLKKMINDFKTFYEKAIAAKDAIEDLNAQLAQLAKQKFDNVKSEFEGFTSEIEHFVSMIDKQLSHVENMDKIAGKSFYNAKMEQNAEKINDLYREREALMQALRDAEANGIEAGSADWIAMRNDIYSVDEAIADLTYEVEDLKKKLKEIAKLNFDNLKEQFENALSILENQKGLTDAVVSMVETSGHMASRAYYESLIEGSKATVTGLRKEYETLTKTLADAIAAGDIQEYDEQWYQMQSDIVAVKNELVDAANATIEYANALRQINWDVFDRGLDTISKLVDESEFFVELLSYDDLFDKDTGDWTNAGITTRGLMVEEFQTYMDQANAYGKEAQEIKKLLETDPKNTTLIDRYYELIEAQRQAILNTKKEQKAVQDLCKQAYDNLLERIKKLIDKYKEALQASKDLYDYENTIQEKNKTINDIRKQLLAYGNGNDTSEENRATLQKLNAELATAQKDLEQTEYDKYIQDQQNLLDQFYTELQEWIDGRLDQIEVLFQEAIEATNLNGLLIDNTLHETADSVNYQMTEEFLSIWDKYASADSFAGMTYDILTLTNDTTTGIRDKMEELPTDANLASYFDGADLLLLEQIASAENNTNNMLNAISMTNEGIDRISSNIVELSNTLGNKIDYAGNQVSNAINSLDFSTGSGSYDAPGGGNYNTGGGNKTTTSSTKKSSSDYNSYKVTGYDERGYAINKDFGRDYYSAQDWYNDLKKRGCSVRIVPYAKGGLIGKDENIFDAIAKLLGEDHMVAAKEGERILTEDQNKNFEKMVNANFVPLDENAKDKYSMLSGVAGKDITSALANVPAPEIGNLTNVGNTTTVGDVHITLPNVTDKEEFVEWLKTDNQVERIIQSMTIGRLKGGNSYNKLRY